MVAMDENEAFRVALLTLFATLSIVVPLAGHWPRLGGAYREGERHIELGHWGPLVWGHCAVQGGSERYLGLAVLGHLRLRRYDAGRDHLVALGFPPDQVSGLEGTCTGSFAWRQVNGNLEGFFYGRRYRHTGGRMVPVERLAAVARSWQRQDPAA